jgi:aspartyl protease family protein
MIRNAIILLVLGTFVGAMMPGRSKPAPDQQAEQGKPAKADWGSAADPLSVGGRSSRSGGSSGPVTLQRASNGHFFADVLVNGTTVHFLVDTGASGIALSRADARRAGVSLSGQSEVIGSGASGPVMGEMVKLNNVRLGDKDGSGVEAMVLDGGEMSLLGQSFLGKFASVEIHGDTMTLR